MVFIVTDGLTTNGNDADLDAATSLQVDGDCVAGTNLYYKLASASSSDTAPTQLYIAYYSTDACTSSSYVGEDQFTVKTSGTTTTTALTSDSSLFGEVVLDYPYLYLYDRCTDDT